MRVHPQEFLGQAEENVQLMLNNHSLDPRRFKVLGTEDYPMILKVGAPRFVVRYLFNAKKNYTILLREATNRSVTVLNASDLSDPRYEI
ncbi:MAG TPA: hypothetical protein VIH61_06790, partial [Waddliaceae bacterium]